MASSGPQGNPHQAILLQPPFFTIPGVSSSSSVSAQMEQIDQLNTLLLQEIDANFAKFHQIVTSRILPDIKKFSLDDRPTRDAAAFWATFFARASGTADEGPSFTNSFAEPSVIDEHTMTLPEGSFAFDPATSSTPLPRKANDSWESSIGSPFDRVDTQLGALRIGNDDSSEMPTPSLPSGYSPLPADEYNYDASTGTVDPNELPSFTSRLQASIAAQPRQPPVPAPAPAPVPTRAPAQPSNVFDDDDSDLPTPRAPARFASPARPRPSTHLIDLTATPLNAKYMRPTPKATSVFAATHAPVGGPSTSSASIPAPAPRNIFDEDDEFDFPMSPPVTMSFPLPPRAQAMTDLARTPAKVPPPRLAAAAASSASASGSGLGLGFGSDDKQIGDLLEEITRGYEPSPRLPTPEGLGRYSILPSDLGPGRRLFDTSVASDAEPAVRPRAPRRSVANTSFGSDIQTTEDEPGRVIGDDEDSDSDDGDSFDDTTMGGSGLGGAQHIAQMQGFEFVDDDSYVSDASFAQAQAHHHGGEFTDTHVGGGRAETEASEVFGRPGAPAAQHRQFALMQQDEMLTYHGGRLEDAEHPDSPTGARR
ncbi:DASH complex subunit ask1 [Apiotrichum porosum]|uniref:DASH complex subunit ASK1 n=1 Tax=Apiotrichum porosum TaxID=105984 RepID=A0A427XJC8_9TREE|nr:DASH complex subunit ask1 [Apiotrichum porosum]RSH78857.1 DASH complex subunit ask1 [Apiotrichum porosum]